MIGKRIQCILSGSPIARNSIANGRATVVPLLIAESLAACFEMILGSPSTWWP